MGDALATKRTAHIRGTFGVKRRSNSCALAGSFDGPSMISLNLITDAYATHAFDALRGIANECPVGVPFEWFEVFFKGLCGDIFIVTQLLQFAVFAPYA